MVEMTAPTPTDVICDPACGTCGFLVAAGEYLREHHPEDPARREAAASTSTTSMFHGFDFDNTMLRIGSMNMLLHGVENPDIRYRDSLAQDHAGEEEKYTLVLANPPFAGSLDYENTRQGPAADRQDEEDRAAVPRAVPAAAEARRARGGDRARRRAVRLVSKAHKELRRMLVEDQKLDAVVSLPAACSSPTPASRPRSCCSPRRTPAAPTTSGSTTCEADGWSLDDKRTPLLPDEKLGPRADAAADRRRAREEQPARRAGALEPSATAAERERPRTAQSFCVPKADIAAAGLRPVAQPLQGSGARGGRASRAEGDPRGACEAGGGDSAGDEGAGGDAEVSGRHLHASATWLEQIRGGHIREKKTHRRLRSPAICHCFGLATSLMKDLSLRRSVFVPAERISTASSAIVADDVLYRCLKRQLGRA